MAKKATTTAVETTKTAVERILISPPKFGKARFTIEGDGVPLVIRRFSEKGNIRTPDSDGGLPGRGVKRRPTLSSDEIYNRARYRSKQGWDGFNAASIRNAMISVCRLTGAKMTLAKLSIFVEADGYDALEPQIPLIRIIGNPIKQEDIGRVATGKPYPIFRPAYHNWSAKFVIRWDLDQFTLNDIVNLLLRVGQQAGIGEGRPNSKDSAGMGWGLFKIVSVGGAETEI